MAENSRSISGYGGLYEVTESGRIISLRADRPLARCNDEYGFHIVRLHNSNGGHTNCNVFDLWKEAYPEKVHSEFKGALKVKYGKGCRRLKGEVLKQ
ncbi:NUMOD4 domain-containing protein [Salimicrobium flavidum]|uniref:NUMOD4 domain-containing protein n=1 Tax=Salimicrobium flavidum TaxID=570947 RepID=A0A1N7KM17_9BACI|nr:NUMOD4 domain-containing protein [Salimicrobium flavidum]SIS62682.1 hypothetical protein SAMN05421687_1143 [Salimicrobium flavidum]